MRSGILAAAGAVVSAMAASACCWLPLVLLGTGFSAAGVGLYLERYRALFLVAAGLLLALGFYLNYRPQAACLPDGSCLPSNPSARRANRLMLWISMALVAAFALFPYDAGKFLPDTGPSREMPPIAGEWVGAVVFEDSTSVRLVIDLGWAGTRLSGEFDVAEWEIENYPVVASLEDPTVHLHFGGPNADFIGTLEAETLTGVMAFGDGSLPTTLRRVGGARFSETYLELASAAVDSALVQRLSPDGTELRERFNADVHKTRLLMLLSPT